MPNLSHLLSVTLLFVVDVVCDGDENDEYRDIKMMTTVSDKLATHPFCYIADRLLMLSVIVMITIMLLMLSVMVMTMIMSMTIIKMMVF